MGTFIAIASQTMPQALPLMGASYRSVLLRDDTSSVARLTTRRRAGHTVAPREMAAPRRKGKLDWGTDRT
jgi:hypothetical protein